MHVINLYSQLTHDLIKLQLRTEQIIQNILLYNK